MKPVSTLIIACLMALSSAATAGGDAQNGKALSATCAACHGADGNSTITLNPILAGQHEDYLLKALRDYKSGARNNPVMAGMVAALSDQDLQDLAAYFAAQKGLKSINFTE